MKCKICQGKTVKKFTLPSKKHSGGDLNAGGKDVPYYECTSCQFLFADYEASYDDSYWGSLDPVHDGRVLESLRLYLWGGGRQGLSVLDYGCGKGAFVKAARNLGITAYGADIGDPRGVGIYPLSEAPKADIVTACEVVEHFLNPVESFKHASSLARDAFVFQTAYYDPRTCGRDWWYLGPANGHVSLYSERSLQILAKMVGAKVTHLWQGYPGIQAWIF